MVTMPEREWRCEGGVDCHDPIILRTVEEGYGWCRKHAAQTRRFRGQILEEAE